MGRHKRDCGISFPCPNGIHSSVSSQPGSPSPVTVSTAKKTPDDIRNEEIKKLEDEIARLKKIEDANTTHFDLPDSYIDEEPSKKILPQKPSGSCQHSSHGDSSIPGKYIKGLGISACETHKMPQAPSDTMSLKESRIFGDVFDRWLRGFPVTD